MIMQEGRGEPRPFLCIPRGLRLPIVVIFAEIVMPKDDNLKAFNNNDCRISELRASWIVKISEGC